MWKQKCLFDEVGMAPSFIRYEVCITIGLLLLFLLAIFYPISQNKTFIAQAESKQDQVLIHIPMKENELTYLQTNKIWIDKIVYQFTMIEMTPITEKTFLITIKLAEKIKNSKGVISLTIKNKSMTMLQKFYYRIQKGMMP